MEHVSLDDRGDDASSDFPGSSRDRAPRSRRLGAPRASRLPVGAGDDCARARPYRRAPHGSLARHAEPANVSPPRPSRRVSFGESAPDCVAWTHRPWTHDRAPTRSRALTRLARPGAPRRSPESRRAALVFPIRAEARAVVFVPPSHRSFPGARARIRSVPGSEATCYRRTHGPLAPWRDSGGAFHAPKDIDQ